MEKKRAGQIFWNAMLLTAASLLMRTVGVSFQVYISNRAGAEAMGLFSLMSGVYGFALTLASAGIHLGVTRVVSEELGAGHPERAGAVMRRAILYALSIGGAVALLLICLAEPIGIHWLKDARTVRSLRLFGITLPLIAVSSALGGYFTAVRRTYKNAAVQVLEQAVKIGASMYLLALVVGNDIESTCCALVLGGTLAETVSFVAEFLLYLLDRRRHLPSHNLADRTRIGAQLMKISLPIALTAAIRSGLVTLQHILIPEGLRNSGASHGAALSAYGSIHSMAMPIILYPAALIASFSGLLIPELAECRVKGHERHVRYMISRVWWLALLFSIGAAGVLICFSEEIGEALYPNTETGRYLRLLAPLIPIMYIDTATDAMMKGLGEQVYSMNVNIADALISVILAWLLIPTLGIDGYLITIYFSELFNTVLSIAHLLSVSSPRIRLFKWVYKPLACIVVSTCLVRFILERLPQCVFPIAPTIALHCVAVLALYVLLLRLCGSIDREDMAWLGTLFCKR